MKLSNTLTRNHATEVRQRREQRIQTVAGHSSRRSTYTAMAPTLIVRGGLGTPVVRRAKTRPRRKMFIPLGMPGVELHMPAIPDIKPGWRLASGLIVILMSMLMFSMWKGAVFQISAPEINGLKRLTPADIEAVLNINGSPILKFDPQAAQLAIEKSFPELKEVNVQVNPPAQVVIDAKERQPVISWEANGKTSWIDKDGIVFPPRGDGGSLINVKSDTVPPLFKLPEMDSSATPAASNSESTPGANLQTERMDTTLFQAILDLTKKLPDGTVLEYSEQEGLGWTDPEGWKVSLGLLIDDLDVKITIYKGIVDYVRKEGINPSLINVAQVYAPYYRLEQ
jgi:hypothetical protein